MHANERRVPGVATLRMRGPVARAALLALALALLAGAVPVRAAMPSDALEAVVAPHFAADLPGACVVVARDGTLLLRRAYGLANVELGVPMRSDLLFRIGSISKTFVAVMTLQLVDEGRLALDAPLSRYLPVPPAWDGVTIAHLLSHTSGIHSLTAGSHAHFSDFRYKTLTVDELIATFRDEPLEFAPGTRYEYNNSGYILLGKLIETVSGRDLATNLLARISGPLGLAHTAVDGSKRAVPGLVSGYTDGTVPAFPGSMTVYFGAGNLVSTADELLRFGEALHGGKLLKPATYARMVADHRTVDGRPTGYGLGLALRTSNGHRLAGHGGDIAGFHGEMETDLETGATAVVLRNVDQFGTLRPVNAAFLSRRLLAVAAGFAIVTPQPTTLSAEQLAALTGTYASPEGQRVIGVTGGALTSAFGRSRAVTLSASSPTTFFLPGDEFRLRFVIESGKAVAVQRYEDFGDEGPLAVRSADAVP